MPHFHIKYKKGRPYLYVREIARVNGRPKVVKQIYLGSPERVASLVTGPEQDEAKLEVEEFGALWLARELDREIDLAGMVDQIIPQANRETGPSVGEYFLYCVWNRMIEAVSKQQLAQWYHHTAIQQIRPGAITELTSQRYWEKWNRVTEVALRKIAQQFFARVWQIESPNADCLLFDTTNYYTFMASHTVSELARRGKNKEGRDQLRQIGLGLLLTRGTRLPLYYCVYPGNWHDSRQFQAVMDDMFGIVCGLRSSDRSLTVIIDKGMNSEANYTWLDQHEQLHFVTTYATYFAEELAATPRARFEPVVTAGRSGTNATDPAEEPTLAYRTTGTYWGKERTVVVTYNPVTARKQGYTLAHKVEQLEQELQAMRVRVKEQRPHWRNPAVIEKRYRRCCEQLAVPADLYTLEFQHHREGLRLEYHLVADRLTSRRELLGKNIIITDQSDWSTAEIVVASRDRWQVEQQFRQSKDEDLVGTRPLRHWTDSKIRCHLFTCVVALTYLRRLELKLVAAGVERTAADVMTEMRQYHSVMTLINGGRTPRRRLETPEPNQAEVLAAFGHYVDRRGVLQPLAP